MKPLFAAAAAALSLAIPAGAQKPTTVVPIQLHSFGYAPEPIVLRSGRPITLVFNNVSGIGHSFKAQAFFASARMLSGMTHDGEIHVKPGGSASVTLIPARGTYPRALQPLLPRPARNAHDAIRAVSAL